MPFSLIYGMEVVIPTEIIIPTQWAMIGKFDNNSKMSKNLILFEELCDKSSVRVED